MCRKTDKGKTFWKPTYFICKLLLMLYLLSMLLCIAATNYAYFSIADFVVLKFTCHDNTVVMMGVFFIWLSNWQRK